MSDVGYIRDVGYTGPRLVLTVINHLRLAVIVQQVMQHDVIPEMILLGLLRLDNNRLLRGNLNIGSRLACGSGFLVRELGGGIGSTLLLNHGLIGFVRIRTAPEQKDDDDCAHDVALFDFADFHRVSLQQIVVIDAFALAPPDFFTFQKQQVTACGTRIRKILVIGYSPTPP